jgi:hypothetical protein
MTSTYYLIEFDGELMFHNDREMYTLVEFKNFVSINDAVKFLLCNKKMIREIFFYDDNENPSKFSFKSNIKTFTDENLDNDIEYYLNNPSDFLKDLEREWNGVNSYVFVNESETLFKLLKMRGVIKNSLIETITYPKEKE